MDLRITPETMWSRVLEQTRQQTARLGELQQQAATGKRILRPSDDPLRLDGLLASKALDLRLDAYLGNLQGARSSLNQSVSALQDISGILSQASTIAIEGSQSTNSAEAHAALAQQVDSLLERLIASANAQHQGRYVFGGAADAVAPFAVTARDAAGRPLAVTYQGEQRGNLVPIGGGQAVATLYAGSDILQTRERGVTLFVGNTGAAAGTGTDSATGQGQLQVRHTATTYAAGSGIAAGTSSAAGDTILGPAGAHQLTITDLSGTGAFGTIALNGGPAVSFTSADSDLLVTGPDGERVYVNTTAITPTFSGTVNITASGTLSVDGGLSTVALNFSANQVVAHSQTGAVTNVNSAGVRRVGDEALTYQGTFDAFQILMALRDDLRNTAGLAEPQQLQTISSRLAELERIRAGVLDTMGRQAADLESLQNQENSLLNLQLSARERIGELEDADLSQVVVEMQTNENLLRLTLAAAAQIMNPTLLDYLF